MHCQALSCIRERRFLLCLAVVLATLEKSLAVPVLITVTLMVTMRKILHHEDAHYYHEDEDVRVMILLIIRVFVMSMLTLPKEQGPLSLLQQCSPPRQVLGRDCRDEKFTRTCSGTE